MFGILQFFLFIKNSLGHFDPNIGATWGLCFVLTVIWCTSHFWSEDGAQRKCLKVPIAPTLEEQQSLHCDSPKRCWPQGVKYTGFHVLARYFNCPQSVTAWNNVTAVVLKGADDWAKDLWKKTKKTFMYTVNTLNWRLSQIKFQPILGGGGELGE